MFVAQLLVSKTMTLHQLLSAYQASVEVSPRYGESLKRTVRKAQNSGLVYVCQLVPNAVNTMLCGLNLSPVTVANIRRELLTLWRYAYEEGITESQPTRIRKIRQPATAPVCWSGDTLARIWKAAMADATLIRVRSKLRRCDILPAWIGIGYDSALRFSDVHALTRDDIRERCVVTTASKTGKAVARQLSEATLEQVARLASLSPDRTLFRWALPRRRALQVWRAFLDEHGFGGSSKWLRRCAATALECRERGAATAFLQHSHPSLAIRHYIDATQVGVPSSPPPISSLADRCEVVR